VESSVVNLEKLLVWANVVYVLAVSLAAVGTFAIYRLSATINAAKDKELARFRTESQVQISRAQADAEQAKAQAASAVEGAERLRQENLKLSIKLEEERKARLELEQKLAPRILTAKQAEMIAEHLRKFPSAEVGVTAVMNQDESISYAFQLAAAIRKGNWKIRGGQIVHASFDPLVPRGVNVFAQEDDNPALAVLHDAIASAGILVGGIMKTRQRPGSLDVVVGVKP